MKKLNLFIIAVLLSTAVLAQAPQKMSYQAVIRNSSDALITNSIVGMKISILQGSPSGAIVYVETQNPLSNDNGLISMEIGSGTVLNGNFAAIDWANGSYFIQTETDPTGGINYTISGVSQFLSVPYALYAENSGNPGPQGATGPQGVPGQNGIDGINGVNGAIGATGLAGTNGIDGLPGATGPQGIQGLPGTNGTNGTNGAVGATGPIGLTGPTGASGVAGPQGIQGLPGTNGTNGATGPAGATGPQGIQGLSGTNGTNGTNGAVGAAGPAGTTGTPGVQGLPGTNGTNGVTGQNGLNALIKTTSEAAGANCTNGGIKIETGLDANGNGVLDAGEVNASQTNYVCNGINTSASSNYGTGVNAQHGYRIFTSDTFFVANESKIMEVVLRGGNGGNGGGSACGLGHQGFFGSGAKFLISLSQGDTVHFKIGINGVNGCDACVPSCNNQPRGDNGTNGTASILSINSANPNNFMLKANPGTFGHGYGPSFTPYGCGCYGQVNPGSNGSLEFGVNYNSSGILNLIESNGLGALVSIRW